MQQGGVRRRTHRGGGAYLPQALLQVQRLQDDTQPQQLRPGRGGAVLQERLPEERHRQEHSGRHVTSRALPTCVTRPT